jgi:PAP2 superfamily
VRWVCLAAVGITVMAGLRLLTISVSVDPLISQLEWPALLLVFVLAYWLLAARLPHLAVPIAIVTDFLLSVLQVQIAMIVLLPLTYLAAIPAFPLLDDNLASLDTLLFGSDWDTTARWVSERAALERLLEWVYYSFSYQAAIVLLIGSITHPSDRNGDFIWSFVIAAMLTSAVFVFTPALGKVGHLSYVEALTAIRGGHWNVLDYSSPQGIISFPSFHTSVGILFVYTARRHLWALAVLIPLNLLLIAAALPIGGHYLVDLPAGAAVAVASIVATRVIQHRLPAPNRCVSSADHWPLGPQF